MSSAKLVAILSRGRCTKDKMFTYGDLQFSTSQIWTITSIAWTLLGICK